MPVHPGLLFTEQRRKKLRHDFLPAFDVETSDCPNAAVKEALGNNKPAKPSAVKLARALRQKSELNCVDREGRILWIDQKIAALQQEKERLVAELAPTWAAIRMCDLVLSPLRRVSADILQRIASYAMHPRPSLSTDEAPMLLAHVCRTWRKAVFEMPTLWRELYIEVDLRFDRNGVFENYTRMVQDWFQRTGSHSLSFHLSTPSQTREIEENGARFKKAFLKALRSIFLRVQHLSIGAPFVLDFLPLFDGHTSHLKTLTIKNGLTKGAEYIMPHGVSLFPSVEKLVLDNPIRYTNSLKYIFPWEDLTSLALCGSIKLRDYVEILSVCRSLRQASFAFEGRSPEDDRTLPSDTPVHHELEDLSLMIFDPSLLLFDIFRRYNFDALVNLEVMHIGPVIDKLENTKDYPEWMFSLNKLSFSGDLSDSFGVLVILLSCCVSVEMLHFSCALLPWDLFKTLSMVHPREIDPDAPRSYQGKVPGYLPSLAALTVDLSMVDIIEGMHPIILESLKFLLSARAAPQDEDLQPLVVLYVSTSDAELCRKMDNLMETFIERAESGSRFIADTNHISAPWGQKHAIVILDDWEEEIEKRQNLKRQAVRLAGKKVEDNVHKIFGNL